MSSVSPTTSPTLLLNDAYKRNFNLSCEPSMHWTPSFQWITINHNLCKMTVISRIFAINLDIDVTTIFSDKSNYPLNFTISATAHETSVTFGGSFKLSNGNCIPTTNPVEVVTWIFLT